MHISACLGQRTVMVEVGGGTDTAAAAWAALHSAVAEAHGLVPDTFVLRLDGTALCDAVDAARLEDGCELQVTPSAAALATHVLREEGRDVSPDGFVEAAAEGCVAACKLYLKASVAGGARCVNEAGWTPLHAAAAAGRVQVCLLLLEADGDGGGGAVDAVNRFGQTPLHLAAPEPHGAEVCALLLERGAGVDAVNEYGSVPLHRAAYTGAEGACAVLLAGGAGVNAANNYGWTPLHLAAHEGHVGTCAMLLRGGADVGALCAQERRTPLHHAAARGMRGVCAVLVGAGEGGGGAVAEQAVRDRRGLRPWELAEEGGEIREMLRCGGGEEGGGGGGGEGSSCER